MFIRSLLSTIALGLLIAGTAQAETLKCFGKKYFYSPYPGAGVTVALQLTINTEKESLVFKTRSPANVKVYTYTLTDFENDQANNQFLFEGVNDTEAFSGRIRYLSSEGVKAEISREEDITYNCSHFVVEQ